MVRGQAHRDLDAVRAVPLRSLKRFKQCSEVVMPDLPAVKTMLAAQRIETPSWAYGNSGTRFKVFAQAGVPRDPWEKLEDAARVHAFTGVASTVSLHIPWDKVDDYGKLADFAREQGVVLGAINSNTFQDDDYKL